MHINNVNKKTHTTTQSAAWQEARERERSRPAKWGLVCGRGWGGGGFKCPRRAGTLNICILVTLNMF